MANMDKKSELLKLIPEQGLLPLYFHDDSGVSIEVLKALYHAGIRAVEYTNRGEAALKNFAQMRRVCDTDLKGMQLGIGTIKSGTMAQKFIDAGADFIICPGLVESVACEAEKHNMLWIPGCMTPTEIISAETLGAKMIKLFPGNILGPSYMEAIKPLFPNLLFMPTGGVDFDAENIKTWFKAGVSAVGMGSKLITKAILENKHYDELTSLTKQALQLVQSARK
jgi:2-dehydro-3-deoxyphosphogluconate aldolase/(4S)-4-hydroxy-2-oxoglutarate aldolase